MNKNLYIIIQSTSNYNEYLIYLFKSLSNIRLSNIWNLHLIVMSDKEPNFNLVPNNINKKIYNHIVHYPYPFNAYLFPNIIYDFIINNNLNDDDYILKVDSDTIFRNGNYYNKFENDLLTNKMIFTISPWIKIGGGFNENNICKESGYEEIYIENMELEDHLQLSFFAGQIKSFKDFFKNKFEKLQIDLIKDWKCKKIPPMNEQSLICYIVSKNKEKYIKDNYVINLYKDIELDDINNEFNHILGCYNTFNIDDYPNIFLIQKFNGYIKNTIRIST